MSDLAAIQARLNAATPRPWAVERDEATLSRLVVSADRTLVIDFGYVGNHTQDDAEFVAHAPDDIRALLNAIARVRDLATRWQASVRPGEPHPAATAVLAAINGSTDPAAGPTVREAAAQDRAHWNDKYAGEGQ